MNENTKYTMPDFDEYIRQGEPSQQEKAYNWQTAIGLQAVDGLRTSDYLLATARQHIEGEIDIDQAQAMLHTYYESKTAHSPEEEGTEEADKVSANIAKILSTRTLAFNTNGYIAVHRQIFAGVFKHAGQLRTYDISKKEWILRGNTVSYLNFEDLRRAIDYDIQQERDFSYAGLTMSQVVEHIAHFASGLWQIHAFREGNTRTTAVFIIQYLRSIGFDVNNDLFARHSWYFRNALVRANYKNAQLGVDYNYRFLELFFRNLLMGEKNELKNRYMLINQPEDWQPNPTSKPTSKPTSDPTSAGHEQDMSRTSTEQVPNKYRTSTEQVPNKENNLILTDNENIKIIISVIGNERKSVKEMLFSLSLKHRPTFLDNYLNPAIQQGYVAMLYPDKPNSNKQKYLLTVKGLVLYNELTAPK